MKLNSSQKVELIKAAKQVYFAFSALDFFKNQRFSNGVQNTLFEECLNLLKTPNKNKTLLINNVHYQLSLKADAPQYQIKLQKIMGSSPSLLKSINEYNEEEILDLLVNQNLILEQTDGSYHLRAQINEHLTIGGKGKIDLYRTHLITLYNMIQKIESEEDISSILVALATGSGKTFIQGLWMLVLHLSGNNGVFALPDKLVNQLKKDLSSLLPEELINKIDVIRQGSNKAEDEQLLQQMSQKQEHPKIILASSEQLLDEHYQTLLLSNSQNTFLSFDEQHLLMKSERRRLRLINLAKNMLTLFLTATPNEETYHLAGSKPVALMSSGQKQKNGQGQFPLLINVTAKNAADKNKLKNYKFWTFAFWQNIYRKLILNFVNSIQEDSCSVGTSIIKELPLFIS